MGQGAMLVRGLVMCLMASLSLVGNISVIAATISSTFLHTSSHILVACLCFFHLLTAVLSMIPIAISCLTSQWVGGEDGGLFCQVFSITVVLLTCIPFNLLVIISLDKFIAVKYPLKYTRIVTKKMVWGMVATVITIPTLGLVPLQLITLSEGTMAAQFFLPYGTCSLNVVAEGCRSCYIMYGIYTALQVIPLFAIIIFYSLIFYAVKQQVQNARAQTLDKKNMLDCHKATITIFLLVLTYILTWLPEYVLDFLTMLGVGEESDILYNLQIASRWIYFLSSVADPYIYALRHNKVQEELRRLLFPNSRVINKPSSHSWDAPFGQLRKIFAYHSIPSYNSDLSHHHIITVGTRNSSLTTSEGSKRPSLADVTQNMVKSSIIAAVPESIL